MERQLPLCGRKSLNPVVDLKKEMSQAAKRCNLSRAEIVDRMNEHISVEKIRTRGKDGQVTEDMLNKWLAPEAPDVIATKLLCIFCKVTNSIGPLQALALPLHAAVIGPAEIVLLEMARAQVTEREASSRKRRLAEQYREMTK